MTNKFLASWITVVFVFALVSLGFNAYLLHEVDSIKAKLIMMEAEQIRQEYARGERIKTEAYLYALKAQAAAFMKTSERRPWGNHRHLERKQALSYPPRGWKPASMFSSKQRMTMECRTFGGAKYCRTRSAKQKQCCCDCKPCNTKQSPYRKR